MHFNVVYQGTQLVLLLRRGIYKAVKQSFNNTQNAEW